MELAMNLYFDGGAGGGGAAAPAPFTTPFPWYDLVWPEKAEIPESWSTQGIEFSKEDGARVGLLQRKNGPCGVLSVLQAYVIIELLDQARAAGKPNFSLDETPSDDIVCRALSRCLIASAKLHPADHQIVICEWADSQKSQITSETTTRAHVYDMVKARYNSFKSEGGLVLLTYSCVLTRGVDAVRADIAADAGDGPLILPPFHICTSELIGLMCAGKAGGNASSYGVDGSKQDWATEVGLLSTQEKEQGIPLADTLKSPPYPVWLLHGGDHFTTVFSTSVAGVPSEKGATFNLRHWNGLPPAGPRMAELSVVSPEGVSGPAPAKHKETFRKSKKGTLDDIVQAREADKKARPGKWRTWEYETVLAVDDPDVKETAEEEGGGAAEGPEAEPEVLFNGKLPEPGPWRCASCYHSRFKTMCFGLNEDTPQCRHCGKDKADALWSLWVHYDDMPRSVQSLANRMFAPKLHVVLWTKWPNATVTVTGKTPSV
eukprot:TRINITY_DN9229_c0_g2_i2.p1 TRINITY_DN9229_c0_g2~~TRINITY_DN9229_c0_g2_i2.p1  ORF type:complete len:547 (+),score=194.08 TRINITY_DN9229_c0_g2_i2:178-1641(+)